MNLFYISQDFTLWFRKKWEVEYFWRLSKVYSVYPNRIMAQNYFNAIVRFPWSFKKFSHIFQKYILSIWK